MDAVIRDVALANTVSGETVTAWIGRRWIDTVTDSGADKVRRSLDDARSGGVSAFRQITQRFPSGLELPIEYTTVRLGGDSGLIAVGKNLQAVSELQSRLVAAQQAMERDYWKLREVETRYRLLFDASNEAVLVLSPEDLRVVEANPAAIRALGLTRGWEFLSEIAPAERDAFRAMLAGVRETGRAPGGVFHLGHRHAAYILRASLMNAESAALYMVQLVPVATPGQQVAPPVNLGSGPLASLLERLPDGFVVLDREGVVQRANRAFLDMVQIGTETAVLGQRLDRWIRRPGADTGRLLANLRRHGSVRMFEITIEGQHGASVEVEVSATGDADADPLFVGIVLRDLSRRQCPANDAAALPTQLFAPLAAATPLRELVQRSVSLVERHYIESALQATEGNRTAAAELLGLSRQSLYAKLGRYGL